jgi:hypothetical protein
MAIDSIMERRALAKAGIAEVEPQIKGVKNKVNDEISGDLKVLYETRLTSLRRRQTKINSAMSAQDNADAQWASLEADGFPELPNVEVPASLLEEIKEEGIADDAAAAGFVLEPQKAVSFDINLPPATRKTS